MRLSELLNRIRSIAPEYLAERWDTVGLQVGDEAKDVRRALLCIDLTEPVMAEAVTINASLIVAYHPPIFDGLPRLTTDRWKGRVILEAARRRIAIYSPHTALDATPDGLNDWLAGGLGAGDVATIRTAPDAPDSGRFKLVTFIPPQRVDRLREALARAGAGQIGDYVECSFNLEGQGTFRPGPSTHPTIGERNRLERVTECRVEMVLPADHLAQVVAALRQTHPYEEPAYDVYPLRSLAEPGLEVAGQGRVLRLDRSIGLSTLVERIKNHLGTSHLRVATAKTRRKLRRVGLCAGAGGSLIDEAGSIDAFLTGEMRHHEVLDATQRDITVILAGHTDTERPYLPVYRKRLIQACGRAVSWRLSRADRPCTISI